MQYFSVADDAEFKLQVMGREYLIQANTSQWHGIDVSSTDLNSNSGKRSEWVFQTKLSLNPELLFVILWQAHVRITW